MQNLLKSFGRVAAVVGVSVSLAACNGVNNQAVGTLAGAGLGAWLGSEIDNTGSGGVVAVAAGTLIGGVIGGSIGRNLDEVDRLKQQQAQQIAFETIPSGTTANWVNPDSGNFGSVVPEPAFQNAQGQYCREFTQDVNVGGQVAEGYGTACRQADGSWKIVATS